MYNNHGQHQSLLQPREDTTSPFRPPQLKWRNCNYKCGWGCEKASDEDNTDQRSENGSDLTCVNSDVEDLITAGVHADESNFEDAVGGYESVVVLENGNEDQHMVELEAHSSEDNEEAVDSLEVGSCTTNDHSGRASSRVSVGGIISPGPGLGGWIEDRQAVKFPPAYLFLQSPLRLSHQHEHCRGELASHLVVENRPHLFHTTAHTWREHGGSPAVEFTS